MRWVRWLRRIVVALIVLGLGIALAIYPPEYVYRVLVWQESDVFDWQKFPFHPLQASPHPFPVDADPRVETLFAELAGQY